MRRYCQESERGDANFQQNPSRDTGAIRHKRNHEAAVGREQQRCHSAFHTRRTAFITVTVSCKSGRVKEKHCTLVCQAFRYNAGGAAPSPVEQESTKKTPLGVRDPSKYAYIQQCNTASCCSMPIDVSQAACETMTEPTNHPSPAPPTLKFPPTLFLSNFSRYLLMLRLAKRAFSSSITGAGTGGSTETTTGFSCAWRTAGTPPGPIGKAVSGGGSVTGPTPGKAFSSMYDPKLRALLPNSESVDPGAEDE